MPKLMLVANTDWYLYNFRLSLAQRAMAEGYEVILVSPRGLFVKELEKAGFRWIEWPVGRQTTLPWQELNAIGKLHMIYKRELPDLVHHFTIKPVIYGSLCAGWLRISRVVNSITGLGFAFVQQGLKARLARLFAFTGYKQLLRRPGTTVIFENSSDQNFFIQHGLVSDHNSVLIEGVGVDVNQYHPVPEPDQTPLVIQASRLLWDKGVGVLVDAARILHKSGTDVRVVLVGEPDPGNPATIELKQLKKWVAEGVVEWWGFQHDMPAIYQESTIVVLPSVREGLPTALIEAAACGKPLIATDVPGCRDVVLDGVNGILVPVQDPEQLARAIQTLLADRSLRQKYGAASRALVLERFADTEILQKTLQVYRGQI